MRLRPILFIALWLFVPASSWSAVADEQAELERLLHEFLAGANGREVHETFWAEDLIYTSSSGERFGKDSILSGFDSAPEADLPEPPSYGGEDVTVRVMGDIAVVTFRLTADEDGERVGEYFNTGVFRKDDGQWQAFTWQATRIPEPD